MTVKKSLEAVEGVSQAVANAKEKTVVVEMTQHIPFETLKAALEGQHTGCAPGATCRERASMNYARVYAPGTA